MRIEGLTEWLRLNKFLERVAGLPFTDDKEGNTLFYPRGVWGSGYIVTSHEAKNNIRKIIKLDCFAAAAILTLAIIFSGSWIIYCSAMLVFLSYGWRIGKITGTMEMSPARLTFRESIRGIAQRTQLFPMAAAMIFSLLLFFAAVFFFIDGFGCHGLAEKLEDTANVIFSGCLLYVTACIVSVQMKSRDTPPGNDES